MTSRGRSLAPDSVRGNVAEAEEPSTAPPRVLRTAFQRKCPEELAARKSVIEDLVRQANEPREKGRQWHSGPPAGGGVASTRAGPPAPVDGPLRFSSAFECGNLLTAKFILPKGTGGNGLNSAQELEYDLWVDNDTQSAVGHTQWFYFCIITGEFQGIVHFRIVNLRKKKSLYQHGLQPHVYSIRRNRGWENSVCEGVSYSSNVLETSSKSNGDIRADLNTLSFSYKVALRDDEVYFASYPPYTYSMLNTFIGKLDRTESAHDHFICVELCRTIGQLLVPLIVVSSDVGRGDRNEGVIGSRKPKPAVFIIARQHPGEVVGSWAVQGLLKFLLGPTPAAAKLRDSYTFHIVPMVNVDGVVYGNSRCTLAGVDPNRVWHDPNPIMHPVVHAVKAHLKNVATGAAVAGGACRGVELFLDFHGHSAKFGCFFYGSCSTAPISSAVFPKMCAILSRDISFEQCHWRCPRTHRQTARYIAYKQFGVDNSFTIECSLYAPVPETKKSAPFTVNFGLDEGATDSPRVIKGASFRRGHTISTFTPSRVEWIGYIVGRTAARFFDVDGCSPLGSDAPEHHDGLCECSELDLLPDISCPKVLWRRTWVVMNALEATSYAEVRAALSQTYGDHVPNAMNLKPDGASDDGASDGDDVPEAQSDGEKEIVDEDSVKQLSKEPPTLDPKGKDKSEKISARPGRTHKIPLEAFAPASEKTGLGSANTTASSPRSRRITVSSGALDALVKAPIRAVSPVSSPFAKIVRSVVKISTGTASPAQTATADVPEIGVGCCGGSEDPIGATTERSARVASATRRRSLELASLPQGWRIPVSSTLDSGKFASSGSDALPSLARKSPSPTEHTPRLPCEDLTFPIIARASQ